MLPTKSQIEAAFDIVRPVVPKTPLYAWPLLRARLGFACWVKHENHTPTGAFKLRGGLTALDALVKARPDVTGLVSATRGNHGQSVTLAAQRHGLRAVIVVPHGNSVEKNAAMRAWGAELVEHGDDFQAANEHAAVLAEERGLARMPSFDPALIRGVATYPYEAFSERDDLDAWYVPIGLGSGISACAAARDALRRRTRIVGVVSAHATAYKDSFEAGAFRESPASTTLADGMACRTPVQAALEVIWQEVDDIVAVTDAEVAEAMRVLFHDTHNVAEGAGAAPLAAILQQRGRLSGQTVGFPLCGGNVDTDVFARVLAGGAG